jgi:hypothetical protein
LSTGRRYPRRCTPHTRAACRERSMTARAGMVLASALLDNGALQELSVAHNTLARQGGRALLQALRQRFGRGARLRLDMSGCDLDMQVCGRSRCRCHRCCWCRRRSCHCCRRRASAPLPPLRAD